ncbi:MAG: hypothetical protein M0Q38_14300 [Bacteroidales bacterium]|jgi:hypothetical protein|nr:hypothetical protein [Bacteroidales bacterium]
MRNISVADLKNVQIDRNKPGTNKLTSTIEGAAIYFLMIKDVPLLTNRYAPGMGATVNKEIKVTNIHSKTNKYEPIHAHSLAARR